MSYLSTALLYAGVFLVAHATHNPSFWLMFLGGGCLGWFSVSLHRHD